MAQHEGLHTPLQYGAVDVRRVAGGVPSLKLRRMQGRPSTMSSSISSMTGRSSFSLTKMSLGAHM